MADDPVLRAERAHLELALACLDAMRRSADRIADYGVDELASHALGRIRTQRLAALSADPQAPPFFGRTDRDPADGRPGTEMLHIGRRHVRDELGDPVVIDWRAPIARAFYRATPADRMGVRLRRRFGFHAGALSSMEDEHLDHGEWLGLASDLLREEIERPRVGPMRDIVATIQPDQDELVRADLDTSLCIQGAPGTGKTAVGLHRAAYLLYTYPDRLRRSGVLVVGPNNAFLHYIAQVLPSLGEGGITQSTVAGLLAVAPRADEPVELAVLKGDVRLAEVLRRAVLSHIAKPAEDVVAIIGTKRYRVGAHHLRRYVDDARRALGTGLRWTDARDRLRLQVAEDVRRQREDAGGAPSDAETAKIARSHAVREWVDEVWPALGAPALLARLYADADFLLRCSRTTLTDAERAALSRPAPRSAKAARWTPADAVLLDELSALIEGTDTFVHAVVDEAQDLSAMQCRAVGRRCPLGSVTVLGDLAQATTPWAPGSWPATLAYLGHEAAVRPLTAGYRVPGEVLELANRLLPHIARDVPPATSIRQGEGALGLAPRASLVDTVRDCLAVDGSIGVIVPDAQASAVLAELRGAGIDARILDEDVDPRVSVLPASAAKGLEFDSVVLVEPAAIVDAELRRVDGLRRLYVVMTRAVSRLRILHDIPLPDEIRPVETALSGNRGGTLVDMTATTEVKTVADVIAAAAGRLLTVDDWVTVGETVQRWELVEGNPVMAPSPVPEHQITGALLFGALRSAAPAGLGVAPDVDLDLQLAPPDGPATVREPDLVVVRRDELARRRREGGFLRANAALLVVEIVSPGSVRTDRIAKRQDYADAGIPYYWILDLEPRPSLTACRLENGTYIDDGAVTGTFQAAEPFPVRVDLDCLG